MITEYKYLKTLFECYEEKDRHHRRNEELIAIPQQGTRPLTQLNGIKKASKDIKDKNKLVSHRNIWVK